MCIRVDSVGLSPGQETVAHTPARGPAVMVATGLTRSVGPDGSGFKLDRRLRPAPAPQQRCALYDRAGRRADSDWVVLARVLGELAERQGDAAGRGV